MRSRSRDIGQRSFARRQSRSSIHRAAVETLEQRRLFTVVFNLQFGAESLQSSNTSKMIQTPPVFHVVLWGTHWGTGAGQFNPSTPENIATAILNSKYLSGLTEYGISAANLTPASVDYYVDTSSDPPSNFNPGNLGDGHSLGQAQTELTNLVNANNITGPGSPSDLEHAPIYVIITDPTDSSTNGGYNTSGSVASKNVNIFSAGTDSNFDNFPDTFSHESAERLSDIEGGGVELDLPNNPNLPTNSIGSPGSLVQVGDGEAEPGGQAHETYRIGGPTSLAMVQPFYSNSFGAYIAPDGNSERFDLQPIWTIDNNNPNNDNFTDTYNLAINGDQLANKNDTIIISRDAAGGTQVTMNGQTAWFDPATNSFQGTPLNSITLNSLTANDTITIDYTNGNPIPAGGLTINGGTGTNTLVATGGSNTWNISGANSGTLNGTVTFSNIQNFDGGNVADTFKFLTGGSVSGNVAGGTAANEALDYSALAGPVTVNLQTHTGAGIGGTFSAISRFTGSAGADTLIGPNANTLWSLNGANSGFAGGLPFASFENLTGGSGNDTFAIRPGASLSGNIDGGGGTNTLTYAILGTPVTVNLANRTASDIGGTINNLQNFVGSTGSDLLIGPAGPAVYSLTALNGGSITGGFTYSSFENLTGTGNGNTFAFHGGGGVSGNIDGGGTGNTLDYSAFPGPVSVNLNGNTATNIVGTFADIGNFVGSPSNADTISGANVDETWTISGANSGSVGADTFSSFENLIGGPAKDNFVFLPGGSVAGNIDGAGGVNTLDYSALAGPITVNLTTGTGPGIGGTFANISNFVGSAGSDTLVGPAGTTAWSITGANAGTVGSNSFSSFENLTGGAGDDTFAFQPGGSVSGNIDGGAGTNTLDYSALAGPITINLQTNAAPGIGGVFANITNFVGSAGSDTLIGPNATTQWNVTGANSGAVSGGSIANDTFSSFENLVGGSGDDTFSIYDGGSLSGNLDGGPGNNTLDYSHYTGNVIVNLALNTATGIGGTITNINGIIGGAGNNMFVGNAANNFFMGGSGRNILIGGGGSDTLVGGAGDNILIGDSTIYDTNMTALNAIFAEWTRTDLSFEQRVADLNSPGNQPRSLNGNYTLDKKSILSDGAPDTLTGGTGLTWAFVTKKQDTFTSKSPRDHVTEV
ncbi:MAG TPA: calcium-binding protein [Tepidisphaeraceae bacterium]|jgi:hypothetical protein